MLRLETCTTVPLLRDEISKTSNPGFKWPRSVASAAETAGACHQPQAFDSRVVWKTGGLTLLIENDTVLALICEPLLSAQPRL